MASVAAKIIGGVRRRRREPVGADGMLAVTTTAGLAGDSDREMRDPIKATTEAPIPLVDYFVASPRAFPRSAPIEGSDPTAMIGAADNSPRADGILAIPGALRITIAMRGPSPHPPESSTQKDAATELATALCATDTDVTFAKIHVVDEPRDSGVMKLDPGVFIDTRVSMFPQRRFGN